MTTLLHDVRSPGWTDGAPVVALLLHGYGSNERDLAGLVPALGLELPWASLRAPIECQLYCSSPLHCCRPTPRTHAAVIPVGDSVPLDQRVFQAARTAHRGVRRDR